MDLQSYAYNTPDHRIFDSTADYRLSQRHIERPKLDAKGWSGRNDIHKQIVNTTVDELKKTYTEWVERFCMAISVLFSYTFNAVAFLPFDRKDQKCVYEKSSFVDAGYGDLNFFIRYVEKGKDSDMKTTMKDIVSKKETIVNQSVLESNGGDVDKFGGIVAVKCCYEFVWY
ncbi:hypothetical protein AAVH_18505 [Aphelenchoides avenae]|nr:hypothetical protein AAVH_18505 [Aphelenchus avenae]